MSKSVGKGHAARSRTLLFVAFVGAAAGFTIAITSMRMQTGVISTILAFVGFMVSIVSLQASTRWWKQADEAVKEAHKSGWYWGGSTGIAIAGGLIAVMMALEPPTSLRAYALFPGDAGLLATGMLIPIVMAFVGYTIAWAAWWLRNR